MKKLLIINLIIFGIVATGWIMNLIKLTRCDFEAPYKAEVIHGLGLISPIGAITGWLSVGK